MRVSYLELYNEELFDLLCTSEDPTALKLRIYEDASKKVHYIKYTQDYYMDTCYNYIIYD